MSFAEIFKENRKRLGFTQEEIANKLMVTPQAVSKWEGASAMPDIALLIPMSRLFGITIDELLGNCTKSSDEISDELNLASGTANDIRERYKIYLEKVKLYPYSIETISRTVSCISEFLAIQGEDMPEEEKNELVENAEKLADEMRKLGEKEGTDAIICSHAILSDVYMSAGEFKKAEKEINYLPYCRYNKARMHGNLRHREKNYEDAIIHYRESISDSIYWLFWDIERLAHSLWRASGNNTTSIKIFKLMYNMIHCMYEDNLYPIPLTNYLLQSNIQLAAENARLGNKALVYKHLDEIVEIINSYESGFGNTLETGCILYPNAVRPFDKHDRKRSYKKWFLRSLEWNSFKAIKEEEKFQYYFRYAEGLN